MMNRPRSGGWFTRSRALGVSSMGLQPILPEDRGDKGKTEGTEVQERQSQRGTNQEPLRPVLRRVARRRVGHGIFWSREQTSP